MKVNEHIKVTLTYHDIEVHAANVASLMDYPLQSDQHMDDTIHTMIAKAYSVISPNLGYVIKPIEQLNIKSGTLVLNGILFKVGKIIASQLKDAEFVAVFYATIGNELELESKKMIDSGDLLEGYTLDLIGSEAAEFVASTAHNTIELVSKKDNFNITNRFSPGYCDWNVSEQFNLFSLFNGESVPIKLNDSALMSPI